MNDLPIINPEPKRKRGRPPGSKNKHPRPRKPSVDPVPVVSFRVSRAHKERFEQAVPRGERKRYFEDRIDQDFPA